MELRKLESKLLYKFSEVTLLEEALTHSSFSNENKLSTVNYERLEFLGDAVLGLVITDLLIKKYPQKSEGELSKARASIVREEVIARVARVLNLGPFLKLGKGEKSTGGRERDSILSCALEAVIGAIYTDSGYTSVYNCIESLWHNTIDRVNAKEFDTDYKTKLQELIQFKYKEVPEYDLLSVTGPSHDSVFKVRVRAANIVAAVGVGCSKKEAQQEAASAAFKLLTTENTII